ncbi:MAG TPA: PHB depolymerase family esterase [Chitinophagaceae bacterium]|nr:PHB depolymerase family esterase [Chitinophagaceae bacterium]
MKGISFLLLFSFTAVVCLSQSIHHFTEGLVISSFSRYGREALYTDQLAYKLYTNTLRKPVAGDSFDVNQRGEVIRWQAVAADSLRRLRSRSAGYIYLTYHSEKVQPALLNIRGNSTVIVNGVLHAGDPYSLGWLHIPVILKKGLNEFYARGASIVADLSFPRKPVFLDTNDPTLPFIVPGQRNDDLMGAIVIINTSAKALKGLQIRSTMAGRQMITAVPLIPAMATRKVIFHFNGGGAVQKRKHDCLLQLWDKSTLLDETTIMIDAVDATDKYSNTFISAIDGSLQYYAVTPQQPATTPGAALFLSVHGAGVEAIGQARAYQSKDWGTLVAATNRRPRGFNWEDWGRIDALEVLHIAKEKFKPDPRQIYLTGHSMGGHGTWFLGATYPDMWAAIAPCAGYPTLKGYGSADGLIPEGSNSPLEQMLLRSGNQSDVIKLASNYKPMGVYVFHGDADRTVSVNYARQMRKILGDFHPDLSYYEYPGGSHWFGDQSVDWKPIFDFFKWHALPVDSAVNNIDFMTANPGISAAYRWAAILQQTEPLQFSRLRLQRNKATGNITGSTENVRVLQLDCNGFQTGDTLKLTIDSMEVIHVVASTRDSLYLLKENAKWVIAAKPPADQKGPHRYGTFKDAFNNNMLFVYGTAGNKDENEWSINKARYDAETWYYRGNGAVDIIPDREFSVEKYKDRGIILYGNKTTNSAWAALLADCPIQVERNKIIAGNKVWQGDDLSAYFVWPLRSSDIASVGVISGTGIKGMNGANANQYFAGASGFPDFMVYRLNMLLSGTGGVKMAGFFDMHWKLSDRHFIQAN